MNAVNQMLERTSRRARPHARGASAQGRSEVLLPPQRQETKRWRLEGRRRFVLQLSSESVVRGGSAAVLLRWRKRWDEEKERWRLRSCLVSDQCRGVSEVHARLLVWIVYIHLSKSKMNRCCSSRSPAAPLSLCLLRHHNYRHKNNCTW